MSEPTNYTAKDIERYLRGEMSAAEMHRLEKAALDDPLLADALDGYMQRSPVAADLQELQNRLQQRIDRRAGGAGIVVPMWLRIAALFVLLAGAGWLAIQTFSPRGSEIAKNNSVKEQQQAPKLTVPAKSPVQTTASTGTTDSSDNRQVVAAAKQKGTVQTNDRVTATSTAPAAAGAVKTRGEEPATADAIQVLAAPAERLDSVTNQTAAATARPLPTDSTGQYGYTENARLRRVAAAKTAAPGHGVTDGEPVNGWPLFENFVSRNRKPVAGLPALPDSSRFVELQFEISTEGIPQNIRVTKSLCTACDAEAIRLLQNGPLWKGKTGLVKIPLSP
ncbi:hypothetical protein [Flavisolibacter nicotianae]|uniref:hypothetical protein n=1 Tax=Flavisolibacter nicotianae TaxID=2364882 RepID=UPI000EB0EC70|nr:hypothetical protein [Flavisolibacter nicotianae]